MPEQVGDIIYHMIIDHAQDTEPVYQRHEFQSHDLNTLKALLPAYPGMDYSIWCRTEGVLLECSIVPEQRK